MRRHGAFMPHRPGSEETEYTTLRGVREAEGKVQERIE